MTRDEWMRRLGPLYPGLVALARTTRLVAAEVAGDEADDHGRAAPWVVAAGAVLGAAAYAAAHLVRVLGAIPALAALAAVLIVGWLGAGVTERSLRAVVAERERGGELLVAPALVLARWLLLIAVAPAQWAALLLLSPVLGRLAALWVPVVFVVDPAAASTPRSAGRALLEHAVAVPVVVVLSALVLVGLVLGLSWSGLLVVPVTAGLVLAVGAWQRGRPLRDRAALVALAVELAFAVLLALVFPTSVSPWQR